MRKRNLIFGVFICLVTLNAFANQSQVSQQRLEQIEKYVSKQREAIEDFYTGRLTEVQLRIEAQIRLLELAEQIGDVELIQWAGLAAARKILEVNGVEHKVFGYFAEAGKQEPTRISLAKGQIERLIEAKKLIAERKNDLLANLGWAQVTLEKQKRYALNKGLPALEQRLIENATTSKDQIKPGVVAAIVYSRRKPAAIINGKIVHEYDYIDQTKIARIHRDRVEFNRNGKPWQQKVQEKAAKYW